MTKQEFESKFKVGDKIACEEWKDYSVPYLVIKEINESHFIYNIYKWYFNAHNWFMYEETKNSHYKKEIEPIDLIDAFDLNFNCGNVIKYVARAKLKGTEKEDLEKALDYLTREIAKL
jgi:hypothetical protein